MANNEVWRQPYTAQQIQNALTNIIPIIDATTGNWWRWDIVNQLFVDSGVSGLSRYIRSIVKTSTSGLTDTYTITFSDATASTFTVSNGKGILSIVLTGTAGLVDTYTIAFNDGTTQRFDVKNGADGVSPTVTISTVAGGHRVTITDADHPGGQSFDVLDGAGSGDMQSAAYDPNSAVAAAGGIQAYVNANAGVTSFNGRTGAVTPASGDYTAAQVGAIPASQKGAAGGVATLNAGGKVPAAQLPDIYTKEETLSDATAAKLAAPIAPETPDAAFNAIATEFSGRIVLDGVYTTRYDLTKGTADDLSVLRAGLATASVGDYALFAGGNDNPAGNSATMYATVDAYNADLVHTTPTELSVARKHLAGASAGDYALFAGGVSGDGSTISYNIKATVDAYNRNLVRTTPTALSATEYELLGVSAGNYALFAGGVVNGTQTIVNAYNSNLVRSSPVDLSQSRYKMGAASVGNYALFAGGDNSADNPYTSYPTVDAYNSDLVRTTPTALSVARGALGAASNHNYALFAGGVGWSGTYINHSQTGTYATVDAYNSALVRTTPTALISARTNPGGAAAGDYAVFAGGNPATNTASNVVDSYNGDLVHGTERPMTMVRRVAGASVGDYALFVSNYDRGAFVDTYKDAPEYDLAITIPAWSKYKFDGFHGEEQLTMTDLAWRSYTAEPVTGYIKRGFTLSGLIS